MLNQIFVKVGHLYKFFPHNINMHVYEHRQPVDMADADTGAGLPPSLGLR